MKTLRSIKGMPLCAAKAFAMSESLTMPSLIRHSPSFSPVASCSLTANCIYASLTRFASLSNLPICGAALAIMVRLSPEFIFQTGMDRACQMRLQETSIDT